MECAVCKRDAQEVEIYEGILDNSVVKICGNCASFEDIPIIRKPSVDQLKRADKSQSVRERMERLSGRPRGNVTDISSDQSIVQRNIARLRAPESKQHSPDVQDNYYWELNIARRRRKLSIVQVSQSTGIPAETLRSIEQGHIPANFEQMFLKLESFFNIKLLKDHKRAMMFRKPGEFEKKLLDEVKNKIENPVNKERVVLEAIHRDRIIDRRSKVEKIKSGKFDFSDRDRLKNVTLNDLVKIKKEQKEHEKRLMEKAAKDKAKEEAMMGDEIDLDVEEVEEI